MTLTHLGRNLCSVDCNKCGFLGMRTEKDAGQIMLRHRNKHNPTFDNTYRGW